MNLRRVGVGAAAAVTLLSVAGCGPAGSVETGVDPSATRVTGDADAGSTSGKHGAPPGGLTCYTNLRSEGFYDFFSEAGGHAATPQEAVRPRARGDAVVLEEEEGGVVAWLLRGDGTAHTRLHLTSFRDGTWAVVSDESCVDSVRPADRRRGE